MLIGLTGNIATGKSTVAGMLSELGAAIIDADKVAHNVMGAGSPVHAQMVDTFGPHILAPNGEIDREQLGKIVFADPEALAKLEAIVHPATLKVIDERIASLSAPVIVVEAIKLIETGFADTCDSIWVTVCRPQQQIQRLVTRRGLSRAEANQRVQAQPSQQEKIARADVVIDNTGSLAQTRAQVEKAWRQVISRLEGQSES
jgi:dephospho-CoA kinase